jgi:drug/metabolite transporter (DMT)-like permease
VLYGAEGLKTASAADFGALVPGTMPVWAILAGWLIFGEPVRRAHLVGAALMAAGAALVLAPELANPRPGVLRGYALLLVMSVSWAAYTVSYRRSGLTPLAATAYVSAYSTVGMAVWTLIFGTAFATAPMGEILWNLASQGLLSGLVSVVLFSEAIRRLGAPQAAAFTALVPVLAAVGGWTLLDEPFDPLRAVAVTLASLGVAAVNGALDRWFRRWPAR